MHKTLALVRIQPFVQLRRAALVLLAACLCVAGPTHAAEYTALLDLDADASTGCTVATADGPVDGVEALVVTTVPDVGDPMDDMVVAVERRDCVDPGTDTFGPPVPETDVLPPWPVGQGLGIDGTDVVESYVSLASACDSVRLAFLGSDGTAEDALLAAAAGPIEVECGTIVDIPTLSDVSLLALALLLASTAAWILARRRRLPTAVVWLGVVLAASALTVGVVAGGGIVLDGDPGDWTDPDAFAEDPLGDAPPIADLVAAFAEVSADLQTLYVRFDVLRGVEPPTITPIDDQTIAEDGSTGPLAFTIDDPDTPPQFLVVEATSNDQTLIPDGNLDLDGTGADRTITATPAADENGTATITVSVSDGVTTTTETFDVTVTPVDDPPTITPIADQSIDEDSSTGPLAFTIDDVDSPVSCAGSVTASSSDQGLIPDGNLAIGGGGGQSCTITATPAADQNGGPVTITVTVDDGTTAVAETFDVTVAPVDDPPTITPIADQSIPEDGTTGPLGFTIDDPDTPIGSLAVVAESSNTTLVPNSNLTLGGSGMNRTIEVVPAADETGTTTITITVDDGNTSTLETFDVTVTPVDDPPTITPIADQTIDEDTSTGPLAFTIDDMDSAVTCGGSVTASSSDQSIIPDGNLAIGGGGGQSCTITATPAADANGGPVTITVTVTDGTTPVAETFDVTVTPVNDAPTHTSPGGLASYSEDDPPTVLDGSIVVADVDDTQLVSATLTLSPRPDSPNELLDATVGGTSIAKSYDPGTGVLTLTGPDTVTNFQAVLRSATYVNTSQDPTTDADAGTADRTVTCVVSDGEDPSAPAVIPVNVTSVNDPPMVTSPIAYTAIGNTLLRVDGPDADDHDTPLPERVASSVDPVDALAKASPTDVDSAPPVFAPGAYTTTGAPGDGEIVIDDDGDFFYTPPTGFTGVDTAMIPVVDGEGGATPVTFQITVSTVIWWIEDSTGPKNPAVGDTGRSTNAFQALGDAEAASGAGDILFVFETDGTPLDEGIALKDGQKLYGQRIEEDADFATLLPSGLILEEIADTNARPQIHRTNGPTITVDATGAALQNVEIRHLDLESGNDDAIRVTTGGTNVATVLIDETVVGDAGTQGVDVDFAHTTGTSTVTLRDNQVAATGDAIDVEKTSDGDVEVMLVTNTGITSSGGRGLRVEDTSGGTGSLYVTELLDNEVSGATTGDGAVFGTVVFDADPSTAGFEAVAGNELTIGSAGDGVGGGGFLLSNVAGDLAFVDLAVEADQAGVVIAGSGLVDTAAGTGFRLATGTPSQIVANAGPALDLDPMTASMTLQSITSTSSPTQGVRLNDIAGAVVVNTGSITGSMAEAFLIDQDTVTDALNVTYSGTITNSAGHLIRVDGYPAGLTTFNGASLSDSGAGAASGQGIQLIDVDGTVTIDATTTTLTSSDGTGIAIEGDTDGTVELRDITVTSPAGTAFSVQHAGASFGGTVDADNVDLTQATNNSRLLEVSGLTTGGLVDFDGASALSATDGTGVRLASNPAGGVSIAGPVDLGTSGSRISDDRALQLAGNGANFVATFSDVDIFTSGQGGVAATGGGRLDILGGGSSTLTVDTLNGRALDIGGIEADLGVDGVTCTHSSDCVLLSSLDPGSDTRFRNVGVSCTGSTCFNVISAGLIRVTGGGNTISATGAVGLRIANTTIDGTGATFESISASSAANGIVLTNTGSSGTFTLTGDGATEGSAGLVTGTTAEGVVLTDTTASLALLDITNTGDDGILATSTDGLTFDRLNLTTIGNADDEIGISLVNAEGDNTFTTVDVTDAEDDAISVALTAGVTMDSFSISGGTINGEAGNGRAGTGIEMIGSAGTVTSASIQGVSIADMDGFAIRADANGSATITSFVADAIVADNLISGGASFNASASGNGTFVLTDSQLTRVDNAQGLIANALDSSTNTTVFARNTVTIVNETFFLVSGIALRTGNDLADSPNLRVTIHDNTITNAGDGEVLFARAGGNQGRMDLRVTDNEFDASAGAFINGMLVRSGSGLAGEADTMCLDISGNDSDGDGGFAGIELFQAPGTSFLLENFAGTGTSEASVESFLQTNNPLSSSFEAGNGAVNFTPNASCNTPAVPPP